MKTSYYFCCWWLVSRVLLVFVLGAATVAQSATTYQWTNLVAGVADGSWGSGANWTPAGPVGGVDNTAQFTQSVTNSAMLTLDGNSTIGNLFFGNTATNAIGWTINPGTPSTSALNLSVSSGTPSITVTNQSATLGVVLAGTQGFTLSGGVLNLNAANTYTGLTTVNSGALVLNNLNALAAGNSLNIAAGSVVQPKLAGTYANVTTTLNGSSRANSSFGGALDFHVTGTETWPGQIILNSATATVGSYGVTCNVTLSGQLTGGGSLTIRPEGGSSANHTATYTLSNPSNNYAGSTTMQVGTAELSATLKAGVKNALPVTTALTLDRAGNSGVVYFDLAGFDQTLAGLAADFSSNTVFNSSGTVATLTVSNSADTTFNGMIGASGKAGINLVKQGSALLVLNGTNSYTGSTTIGNGTLALNGIVTATSSFLITSNTTLQLALGAPGGLTNIVVNGNVTLAGQINVNDFGIVSNTTYPVIYYTGTLTNSGITAVPLAPCAFTIDTSVPHVVSLVVGQKYPLVEFFNTNFAVTTLTTNLSGYLRGAPAGPIWYEVRDQTNKMWDFGATLAVTPWNITVRHLRAGTNTVTIFAQDGSGNIQSNSIQLTLNLGAYPNVRPRPIPSEIWWGGISDNTGLTNYLQWPFVQKYQDGYLLHGAYWNGTLAWLLQSLSQNLQPFNTKFMPELAGNIPNPNTNSAAAELSNAGGKAAFYEANGIILSEFTHDYHMENMEPLCQVNPTWSTNDQVAWWTGDLSIASTNYPYTSGIWGDVFNGYYQLFPHVKVGHTSSPVWWPWDNYPALDGNRLAFTVTNSSGKNVPFSFTAHAIIASFVKIASTINHPYYSLQSDCPWDYFGFNGSLSTGAQNRQKIRTYEQFLQSRDCRHTLICNVSNAGSNYSGAVYYEVSSLSSMYLHQQEGGRANRYLHESWYWGVPSVVVPETLTGSYTHLALSAIKYLKGIKDTNGSLEQLNLTPTRTNGTLVQLQLQNNGDVQCLPALAGQSGTVPGVNTRYFTTNGMELTAAILTAEGLCFTNMLLPATTTNIIAVTLASGIIVATNENDSIEAFWNPQDPLGIVRDREIFSPLLNPLGLWEDTDIGGVGVGGGSALSGTNFTLLGSGADIWGTADAFHFVYQTNNGDGTITARVSSQLAADAWSKAGVMIRESTATGARNVFIGVTPNNGVSFQNRPVTSGLSYSTVAAGPVAPYWVRLTRSGTTFTAQYSANNTSWTTLGSSNVTGFATSALWGLAVTAHNTARASAATFDNITLPNAAPVLTTIGNQILIAGQTLTVTNSAFDLNVPPQTLAFGLVSAPTGVSLDSSSGVLTWRPAIAQSPSTNTISVQVADNGSPSLSATNSFNVTVIQPAKPIFGVAGWGNNQFSFTVNGDSGPDYIVSASTNLLNWSPLWTNFSPVLPFGFTNATTNFNQRFYRILLAP